MQLVGILNITPDSFSDGGKFTNPYEALIQTKRLFDDGAAWVDVGAEATNPSVAAPLSPEEEWQRLEPVLPRLLDLYPGRISLDTYHSETAAKALALGNVILNDVTTFRDPHMIELAVRHGVRCIVSHLPFSASSIAEAHRNPTVDSIYTVKEELLERVNQMVYAGVSGKNIILDPGIGFGKTMAANYRLLHFASLVPRFPVIIGHSRKRFIEDHYGTEKTSVESNLRAGRIACRAGARYLRVHDPANYANLVGQK